MEGAVESKEALSIVQPASGVLMRSISWSVPQEQFVTTALRQVRTGFTVPLHGALANFPAEIVRAIQAGSWDDVAGILDCLTRLTAVGITAHQDDLTEMCVRSLKRMHVQVFRRSERAWQENQPRLARLLLERLLALGGLAVRLWSWKAIPLLVRQWAPVEDRWEKTWIQQCHSQAGRGGLPTNMDPKHVRYWSVQLAEEYAWANEWLRSDIVDAKEVTASLCQFDALATMIMMEMTGDEARLYPFSFVHRSPQLTEPIITELARNEPMRKMLFSITDDRFCQIISQIDKLSRHINYNWEIKESVRGLIAQHSDPNGSGSH